MPATEQVAVPGAAPAATPVNDAPPLSAHVFVVAGKFPASLYNELAIFGTKGRLEELADAFADHARKKHTILRKRQDQVHFHDFIDVPILEAQQQKLAEKLLTEQHCGDRTVHFDVFDCTFGPLSEQVTALVAWTDPVKLCRKCRKQQRSELICPHCGSVRWALPVLLWLAALILIGVGIAGLLHGDSSSWGAFVVSSVIVLFTLPFLLALHNDRKARPRASQKS